MAKGSACICSAARMRTPSSGLPLPAADGLADSPSFMVPKLPARTNVGWPAVVVGAGGGGSRLASAVRDGRRLWDGSVLRLWREEQVPFVELFDDLERLAESALLCAPAEEHVVRQAETESMTVEETRIDPIGIHPDMGG